MQKGVSAANGACKQGDDGDEMSGLDPGLSTTGHGKEMGGIKTKSNGWSSARQHLPEMDAQGLRSASPKSLFDSQAVLEHINAS